MNKYYVSSLDGPSGIAAYSKNFYELIGRNKGYRFISSNQELSEILSIIGSRDHVHLEIGIFQKKEIEILFVMLRAGYKNISITLHDAPLVKYPFYDFNNSLLNKLSRVYDHYGNRFSFVKPYLEKIKSIYVLTKRGLEALKNKYNIKNVFYLPHIVDTAGIEPNGGQKNDFIYFGFIGANKGIEYSLQLHKQLLESYPEMKFYVVGTSIGAQRTYLEYLKKTYKTNVEYLGFVPEDRLGEIFSKATFAPLFFKDYKYYYPCSGSILYSLKKGKVVLTNNVNSIGEIIENGKTGFFLSGNLKGDVQTIKEIISDTNSLLVVKKEAAQYLATHHSVEVVNKMFFD
jgi:glycosyltransferase involved in cell wall biosynthesis